ncbi:hypothetical protein ANCCAN_04075 [Ancylostoma caninum]|uniref:CHK kinase-like domain-containing protein n=1 Tax=Ancylostoma caninum TaxID=29170 RepID=A0A368GZQ6_ANCCA|nr:hypothetical protein ANCCAN_04075 [Ancylostoma caninum]
MILQKCMRDQLVSIASSQTRSMSQKLLEDMPEQFSCLKKFLANTIDKDPKWINEILDQYESGGNTLLDRQRLNVESSVVFQDAAACSACQSFSHHIVPPMWSAVNIKFGFLPKLEYTRNDFLDRPFVLAHGDLWTAQVLWRDENTIAGIVDWQFVHRASPVEDILRVLALCTSTANRRKLLHPLLDHYYEKMKEQLGADMPFSREYLDDELKFVAPWCCMWTVADAALFINSNMVIRNGKVCSERVNEIVRRCVSFVEDVIKLCEW